MNTIARLMLLLCSFNISQTWAQLPGGRPQDAQLAIQNPHEYAWRLFLALSVQAASNSAGAPETGKTIGTYDDDKPIVWETWALASGGRAGGGRSVPNRSEVFLDKGAQPSSWEELPRANGSPKRLEPMTSKRLEFLAQSGAPTPKIADTDSKSPFHIQIDPTIPERAEELFEGGQPTGDEVRMNRDTFDFVRKNKLYSIEGLEAAFSAGTKIEFTNSSQEIKAQWVKITDKDKPRYHWRSVKNSKGETATWGLSGLHIITRDLPNWFWCDFEHEDFTSAAELASVDSTTRNVIDRQGNVTWVAPARGSKDGIRKETEGSKWSHYRLRGTQTDFTDSKGIFTVVANSQIEKGFQQTSSCITCHARATVGLRSSDPRSSPVRTFSLPVFEARAPFALGSIGSPKSSWYVDEFSRPRFIQTDFLWSVPFRACSESETPPSAP